MERMRLPRASAICSTQFNPLFLLPPLRPAFLPAVRQAGLYIAFEPTLPFRIIDSENQLKRTAVLLVTSNFNTFAKFIINLNSFLLSFLPWFLFNLTRDIIHSVLFHMSDDQRIGEQGRNDLLPKIWPIKRIAWIGGGWSAVRWGKYGKPRRGMSALQGDSVTAHALSSFASKLKIAEIDKDHGTTSTINAADFFYFFVISSANHG